MVLTIGSPRAYSQIVVHAPSAMVTIEAYGNLTSGATIGADSNQGRTPDTLAFDGAARILARLITSDGPNVGLRVVAEGSNNYLRVSEASVLLFGSGGRLEIGKRMGLPDVLTGYAPNSFTFTTAEFWSAYGPDTRTGRRTADSVSTGESALSVGTPRGARLHRNLVQR